MLPMYRLQNQRGKREPSGLSLYWRSPTQPLHPRVGSPGCHPHAQRSRPPADSRAGPVPCCSGFCGPIRAACQRVLRSTFSNPRWPLPRPACSSCRASHTQCPLPFGPGKFSAPVATWASGCHANPDFAECSSHWDLFGPRLPVLIVNPPHSQGRTSLAAALEGGPLSREGRVGGRQVSFSSPLNRVRRQAPPIAGGRY